MTLSIRQVTIRRNGHIEIINLEDMTQEKYHNVDENLYCPNEDCNAKILFCDGPKRTYFRTKPSKINGQESSEQHIEGCPYSVEHDKDLKSRKKYDPDLYVDISEKHLKDALKRAQKKFIDPDYGKKSYSKSKSKSKSKQSKEDDTSITRGKASLAISSNDLENKDREANIYKINVNDITEIDYGTRKIVTGVMENIVFTENYIYI